MTTIPPFDKKLETDLRYIQEQLLHAQNKLIDRHPGCVCTEDGHFCAHHAAIYKYIESSMKDIKFAIQQINAVK